VGCDILNWMKGELAVIIFLIVAVVTIVVGMFARMDWSKILGAVVLYGILQGLATILLSSGAITLPSCFS
jgi:type IV secretory pathway VirB2 component (pilin)